MSGALNAVATRLRQANCSNCLAHVCFDCLFLLLEVGCVHVFVEIEMARAQSPGYPNASLPKAIQSVRMIFDADRRNPIDREVAAKHIGYGGSSGASDKALATLAHYGLTEKVGKGEIRVSQLALDIVHPDKPEDRKRALVQAAFSPQVFKDLRERFGGGVVSEGALESYLKRENFLDRAIGPVTKSYLETCRFLEQEKAFENAGDVPEDAVVAAPSKRASEDAEFGGARLGDLIQWESQGVLQLESPARVRLVSDDGLWVCVEDSETGIPMSEVVVQERAALAPPRFALPEKVREQVVEAGELEWMRNRLGADTKIRLMVTGEMGPKQIGKLIKLLKAQQAVLEDDDDTDDE